MGLPRPPGPSCRLGRAPPPSTLTNAFAEGGLPFEGHRGRTYRRRRGRAREGNFAEREAGEGSAGGEERRAPSRRKTSEKKLEALGLHRHTTRRPPNPFAPSLNLGDRLLLAGGCPSRAYGGEG